MTIERLELLSDDVLANLAKKVGLRLKQDWSRSKIIEMIIEALEEDRIEKESLLNLAVSIESKKYSVTIDEELDLAYDVDEEMTLPERYNETKLHFLLRDNSWGFVMWDIKDSQHLKYKNQIGEVSYLLRIIELDSPFFDKKAIVDFFDIEVQKNENSRYIGLPSEDAYYCVEFILVSDEREIIIDRSQVMKTTRDHVNAYPNMDEKVKKIIELSGYTVEETKDTFNRSINRILPMDSVGEAE